MGMDVYGKAPSDETTGKYFRNNVWWWRPLADYVCNVAPELAAKCEHWQSNDGDGLNAADSAALADVLAAKVAEGHTEAYAAIREAEQRRMPDEKCWLCHGSGVRSDAVGVQSGYLTRKIEAPPTHPRLGQVGWCNACDGRGFSRPSDTNYPFSVENVQEFAAFLRTCGGFEIC